MYGCQFSGEKNSSKIQYLVAEILSKNRVLFSLGHPKEQCSLQTFPLKTNEQITKYPVNKITIDQILLLKSMLSR